MYNVHPPTVNFSQGTHLKHEPTALKELNQLKNTILLVPTNKHGKLFWLLNTEAYSGLSKHCTA